MKPELYIIDVFSLLFQVYHGIPPMTGPAGQPTNAVFGFCRDLIQIMQKKKPTHLICAMDSPGPGIRTEWYPDYKSNRQETPEDLRPQIPLTEEAIRKFNIPVYTAAGWEADDVLATVTRQALEKGFQVSIVSSDKDCRQLLGPNVRMYNCRKNSFYGVAELEETWGIWPEQVIDFQSLVGDSVDHVPGVPLVGPKKATALLKEFETLDTVLANSEKAPGKKLRENLQTYAEQARLSRDLVTLKQDLPLEVDWEQAEVGNYFTEELRSQFDQLGFRRLKDDLANLSGPYQLGLFAVPAPAPERSWNIIETEAAFTEFCDQLAEQTLFSFDLETTSLHSQDAEIVGWAFCWETGKSDYLPILGPESDRLLDGPSVLKRLRPFLENPEIGVRNQNLKYEMLVLQRYGVQLRGLEMDPMVGHYLLDAGARSHSLDALAEKYLQRAPIPISDLIGKGKEQKSMAEVPIDQIAEYASEDADIAWQLGELIIQELQGTPLESLYQEVERPLIPVLAEMEANGIRVDEAELRQQAEQAQILLDKMFDEMAELATGPTDSDSSQFNPNSPKQLREILFEKLNLPVQKKNKTGPSTDHSVLERLAHLHPLPAKIIEHRQLAKLKNTYLGVLPQLIHPKTKRIHTSFNQVVAATGRLSSSDPNLQNIPIRSEAGRKIRRAFIPAQPDWVFLCADYSQIELRMLAELSGDENLLSAFRAGQDIHASVAAEVFEVNEADVDAEMRRVAKAVNFGIIYGQSSFGLAAALQISRDEAAQFIDNYFARYPQVEDYLAGVLTQCKKAGYSETILGRRRTISGIKNIYSRNRNMAERTAINSVIQGSAADLIKLAMIRVSGRLKEEREQQSQNQHARLLLQIHDELVLETPADSLDSLALLVQAEMEQAMENLQVPLRVDLATGLNWYELSKLTL